MDLRIVLDGIAQLLYPPKARCLGCGSKLGVDEGWLCDNCIRLLSPLYLRAGRCDRCGMPLDKRGRCRTCAHWPWYGPSIARSAFLYQPPISSLVRTMKYYGTRRLAPFLGSQLALALAREPFLRPDALLPVPMHARARRRSGNHALWLARALGDITELPVFDDRLTRTRKTRQQAKLSAKARMAEQAGAFAARGVDGLRILLIDDVMTTGSTACHCAYALRQAGAKDVQLLTVAGAPAKNM